MTFLQECGNRSTCSWAEVNIGVDSNDQGLASEEVESEVCRTVENVVYGVRKRPTVGEAM